MGEGYSETFKSRSRWNRGEMIRRVRSLDPKWDLGGLYEDGMLGDVTTREVATIRRSVDPYRIKSTHWSGGI